MMENWSREIVESDDAIDGKLQFDVWSIGDVDAEHRVLALHGFPQSAKCFEAIGRRLAHAGVRVVAPDQRGYSANARPVSAARYAATTLAADVTAISDAMGMGDFHLLGHDWGAQVGWVLAHQYPERVQSLTALSVPHPRAFAEAYRHDAEQRRASAYIQLFWDVEAAERELLGQDAARLRALLEPLEPDQIDYYVERMKAPGALNAALNWYRAMTSDGATFPNTTVPTTYVWSENDPALRRAAAELCGSYVDAEYRYVPLADTSHWIPEEAPDQISELVLERIRQSTR